MSLTTSFLFKICFTEKQCAVNFLSYSVRIKSNSDIMLKLRQFRVNKKWFEIWLKKRNLEIDGIGANTSKVNY